MKFVPFLVDKPSRKMICFICGDFRLFEGEFLVSVELWFIDDISHEFDAFFELFFGIEVGFDDNQIDCFGFLYVTYTPWDVVAVYVEFLVGIFFESGDVFCIDLFGDIYPLDKFEGFDEVHSCKVVDVESRVDYDFERQSLLFCQHL